MGHVFAYHEVTRMLVQRPEDPDVVELPSSRVGASPPQHGPIVAYKVGLLLEQGLALFIERVQ